MIKKEVPGIFDGPILPLLKKLSLPIFMGMCLQFVYNLTDKFWVSRIANTDGSYLGAVGLIYPIIFLSTAIASGINVGLSSIVARCIGSKNYKRLNKTVESGLIISIILGVVTLFIAYLFGNTILAFLGARNNYLLRGVEYFYFIIPTAAILFITNVFTGIFQGEGMMKPVMISMLISTVANIILDPIFIFLFKMDIRGAGLATTIGSFIGFLYIITLFMTNKSIVKVKWKLSNIDGSIISEIISIGGLQTLSQSVVAVSLFIFNAIMINIDKLALTAYTICLSFEQLILYLIFAISSAVVTIVGQNYGRKLIDRVKETWKVSVRISVILAGLISIILFIFAPFIYSIFSGIKEVVHYSVLYTRIVEISFVFATASIIARAYFQAIGKPFPGFVLTLLRLLIITVPVALALTYIFNFGIYGAWIGIITGNVISAIISFIWVNRSLKNSEIIPEQTLEMVKEAV